MRAAEKKERLEFRFKNLQPDPIVTAVMSYCSNIYRVSYGHVLNHNRNKQKIKALHVGIYLLREFYGIGYEELGFRLNRRDHSTIVTAYHKIKYQGNIYPDLKEGIDSGREFLISLIGNQVITKT